MSVQRRAVYNHAVQDHQRVVLKHASTVGTCPCPPSSHPESDREPPDPETGRSSTRLRGRSLPQTCLLRFRALPSRPHALVVLKPRGRQLMDKKVKHFSLWRGMGSRSPENGVIFSTWVFTTSLSTNSIFLLPQRSARPRNSSAPRDRLSGATFFYAGIMARSAGPARPGPLEQTLPRIEDWGLVRPRGSLPTAGRGAASRTGSWARG